MKDLQDLSAKDFEEFFQSFDNILSDVDGVLWNFLEEIPGSNTAVKALKHLGKKIFLVSNNTTKTLAAYHQELLNGGFNVKFEEIITPLVALTSYLKQHNVKKEVFVLGMSPLRQALQEAGFNVAAEVPFDVEEDLESFSKIALANEKNIGVVIADADINLSYLKIQKALCYLKDPNVMFITGARDLKIPVSSKHSIMGPGYVYQMMEETAGRKAVVLAKPSPDFNESVMERFKIEDKSRVLFIGDQVMEDMAFAKNCGYKTLLVLSGLTTQAQLLDWSYPEQYKPEYYVKDLKTFYEILLQRFPNKV